MRLSGALLKVYLITSSDVSTHLGRAEEALAAGPSLGLPLSAIALLPSGRIHRGNNERNQVYETETSLSHDDRCHSATSVDGWVRHHNDLSTGKSEHARSRRL
jgi:hypothetical protein